MTDVALMRSVTMQRHGADDSHCRKSAQREPRPDVSLKLARGETKSVTLPSFLTISPPIVNFPLS